MKLTVPLELCVYAKFALQPADPASVIVVQTVSTHPPTNKAVKQTL